MKLGLYFTMSIGAMVALVMFAVYTREQFYPTVLFLVTSKVSYVVGGNMIFALAFFIARLIKTLFLGTLESNELEMLADKAKYTIVETCLALTIFRAELTPPIIGMFGGLLFLNAFHWLAKARIDCLDQYVNIAYSTHLRLLGLLVCLLGLDLSLCVRSVNEVLVHGKSVMILFAFEFGLLLISLFNMSWLYLLQALDSRGLVSKRLPAMLVDLLCDAFRFITYMAFFCLIFVYYGLPIYLMRELWSSFYVLQKNVAAFVKYLRITRNLDQRFADASADDLSNGTAPCMICREPMTSGKKLPCGHVLHLHCLRDWFQRSLTCPTCRAAIPVTDSPPAIAAAAAAAGGAEAAAADAAAVAARPGAHPRPQIHPRHAGAVNAAAAAAAAAALIPPAHGGGGGGGGDGGGGGGGYLTDGSGHIVRDASGNAVRAGSAAEAAYAPHRAFDSPHDRVHTERAAVHGGRRSPSVSPSTAVTAGPEGGTAAAAVGSSPPADMYSRQQFSPSFAPPFPFPFSVSTGRAMPALPQFFIVLNGASASAVHLAPSRSSGVVRTLLGGTVVFVTEVSHDPQAGREWARVPDGWVLYRDSVGPPALAPYDIDDQQHGGGGSGGRGSRGSRGWDSQEARQPPPPSYFSFSSTAVRRTPEAAFARSPRTDSGRRGTGTSSSGGSSSARRTLQQLQERLQALGAGMWEMQAEVAAVQGDLTALLDRSDDEENEENEENEGGEEGGEGEGEGGGLPPAGGAAQPQRPRSEVDADNLPLFDVDSDGEGEEEREGGGGGISPSSDGGENSAALPAGATDAAGRTISAPTPTSTSSTASTSTSASAPASPRLADRADSGSGSGGTAADVKEIRERRYAEAKLRERRAAEAGAGAEAKSP